MMKRDVHRFELLARYTLVWIFTLWATICFADPGNLSNLLEGAVIPQGSGKTTMQECVSINKSRDDAALFLQVNHINVERLTKQALEHHTERALVGRMQESSFSPQDRLEGTKLISTRVQRRMDQVDGTKLFSTRVQRLMETSHGLLFNLRRNAIAVLHASGDASRTILILGTLVLSFMCIFIFVFCVAVWDRISARRHLRANQRMTREESTSAFPRHSDGIPQYHQSSLIVQQPLMHMEDDEETLQLSMKDHHPSVSVPIAGFSLSIGEIARLRREGDLHIRALWGSDAHLQVRYASRCHALTMRHLDDENRSVRISPKPEDQNKSSYGALEIRRQNGFLYGLLDIKNGSPCRVTRGGSTIMTLDSNIDSSQMNIRDGTSRPMASARYMTNSSEDGDYVEILIEQNVDTMVVMCCIVAMFVFELESA